MLFKKYDIMTKPFEDAMYLNEKAVGVFFLSIEDKSILNTNMDVEIMEEVKTGDGYVILENLYSKGKLLQRLTFVKSNVSYIRTARITGKDVGNGFKGKYTENGHEFTDWVVEHIKEDDIEVQRVLNETSKEKMHKQFVPKNDDMYNRFFKYIGRLNTDNINSINLQTGIYSIVEKKDTFVSWLTPTINKDHNYFYDKFHTTKMRERSYGFHPLVNPDLSPNYVKNVLSETYTFAKKLNDPINDLKTRSEGVLEVYNGEKYIYQNLHISLPFILHANRVYDKTTNEWTSWRTSQMVSDIPALNYASPANNYVKFLRKRLWYINPNDYVIRQEGYKNVDAIKEDLNLYRQDIYNAMSKKFSQIYNSIPSHMYDFVYGYLSPQGITTYESGFWSVPTIDPRRNINTYPNILMNVVDSKRQVNVIESARNTDPYVNPWNKHKDNSGNIVPNYQSTIFKGLISPYTKYNNKLSFMSRVHLQEPFNDYRWHGFNGYGPFLQDKAPGLDFSSYENVQFEYYGDPYNEFRPKLTDKYTTYGSDNDGNPVNNTPMAFDYINGLSICISNKSFRFDVLKKIVVDINGYNDASANILLDDDREEY